jgi:hypothetical protein
MVAQINANANAKNKTETKTKLRPNPKAEPSTHTGTYIETNTNSHIGGEWGADISTDTDQTMGESPTTKPKDAGQPSPSPNDRLKHGRQTPNP